MEKPVKGDVVVIPFPFSDLTGAKKRPALVIADAGGDDVIMCQITSRTVKDEVAIAIDQEDFVQGGLNQPSNVRPNKVFTVDKRIVLYRAGRITHQALEKIVSSVVDVLKKR